MTEEKVILVNDKDEQIGLMPKLEAHEKAMLHRAFSVFVLNDNIMKLCCNNVRIISIIPLYYGLILVVVIQREGETNIQAGTRRLQEEMGFVTELKRTFSLYLQSSF